jgi:hypothetical protein
MQFNTLDKRIANRRPNLSLTIVIPDKRSAIRDRGAVSGHGCGYVHPTAWLSISR